MRLYIQEFIKKRLADLFDNVDAETVLSWWIANESRKPVVVVGSGFTRNAVYKATQGPVAAKDAPLWHGLSTAFASDLRLDPTGVDPLMLAELHRDGLGDARFVDLLLGLLPDDQLDPGGAHKALFDLRPEAIITTNFLDTLLDRDSHALPVYEDESLARLGQAPGKVEVLYLHGHRSSPKSWVASRTQYQDLPRKIPVLLTRVRQLLAQHPVLTVGFSLTDPDFHQIYREVSLDMRRSNLLGLALLAPPANGEVGSEQEAAQRRHWERLGMRIARFKSGKNLGGRLTEFFQVTSAVSTDEIIAYVEPSTQSFPYKIDFAKSALEDEDQERLAKTDQWRNRLWLTCIRSMLSEKELKSANRRYLDYQKWAFNAPRAQQRGETDSGSAATRPAPRSPELTCLSEDSPVQRFHELTWIIDHWLHTRSTLAHSLAAWLCYRLESDDWSLAGLSEPIDVDIAHLLGAVWEYLKCNDAVIDTHECIRQLNVAHKILQKYAPKHAAWFESLIGQMGGLVDAKQPEAAAGPMKTALCHMMNEQYGQALVIYEKMYDQAMRGDNAILAWLAATGRHQAQANLRFERSIGENQEQKRKEYATAQKEASEHPRVRRWLDKSQSLIRQLKDSTIEDLQEQLYDRGHEVQRGSLSNMPHYASRAFRDLDDWSAPPWLLDEYLQPLLDYGAFDATEEFMLRLRYKIEKTDKWLEHQIDNVIGTNEEILVHQHRLVEVWNAAWTAPDATLTTMQASMEAMPSLLDLLTFEQERLALDLLRLAEQRRKSLGTKNGQWLEIAIQDGWCNVAAKQVSKNVFLSFRDFIRDKEHDDLPIRMIWRVSRFPWATWVNLDIAAADELVQWLASIGQSDSISDTSSSRVTEFVLSSIADLAHGIEETGREFSSESWELIVGYCENTLTRMNPEVFEEGVLASILLLNSIGRGVELRHRARWLELEDNSYKLVCDRWQKVTSEPGVKPAHVFEVLECVNVAMQFEDSERWTDLIDKIWPFAIDRWSGLVKFVSNNHRYLPVLGWFLASTIEYDIGIRRGIACRRLLEVWPISSTIHHALLRILDPQFWPGELWTEAVKHIQVQLGGARGSNHASWRMGISSLLQNAILRSGGLTQDLSFLLDPLCSLVSNEDALVANHAAYAVMAYSAIHLEAPVNDARTSMLVRTLDLMAADPRLPVRQAAAFAGGFLPMVVQNGRIRECALAISTALSKESYSLLHRQLALGKVYGKSYKRRSD